MLKRFIDRMSLPSTLKFVERNFIEFPVTYPEETTKVLELYHAVTMRALSDGDSTTVVKNILRNGFRIGSADNKGYGVYMANHSRYSLNWAGENNPVLVCHVLLNDKHVNRFHSEICSPLEHSYEYVIKDPSIIFVKGLIQYSIEGHRDYENAFVPLGEYGCNECDNWTFMGYAEKGKRCDCSLSPSIHPYDIVTVV